MRHGGWSCLKYPFPNSLFLDGEAEERIAMGSLVIYPLSVNNDFDQSIRP